MAETTWSAFRDGERVVHGLATRRDAVACAFDPALGMTRDELRGLNAEDHETAGWAPIHYGRWQVRTEGTR